MGSGVAIRVLFPELTSDSEKFRTGVFLGAIGVGLAIGLLPAFGCAGISFLADYPPNAREFLLLVLPGVIVFLETIIFTPIGFKFAGRIISS